MSPEYREAQVRAATEADLGSLTDLYDHYVRETPITFDTEPRTPERRRSWLLSHPEDGPHRLLVARGRTNRSLLGHVTSTPFRIKPAYATSVEVGVHCAREAVGRGVGRPGRPCRRAGTSPSS